MASEVPGILTASRRDALAGCRSRHSGGFRDSTRSAGGVLIFIWNLESGIWDQRLSDKVTNESEASPARAAPIPNAHDGPITAQKMPNRRLPGKAASPMTPL